MFLARVPASLAADVSNGTALLAAVNDGTVGSIRLKANVTTPFAWTQAGVFITRDLVIESDTDACGDVGCHVFGHDSRDFVRVADGATVTMRKIILGDRGDTVAPYSYEGGAVRVVNGTLVAEDCQFTDNVGLNAGAVDVGSNGFARFERCVFVGNVAASQNADDKYKAGGAVRFDGGDGVVTDCEFRGNRGAEGAAVHVPTARRFVRADRFRGQRGPVGKRGANHLQCRRPSFALRLRVHDVERVKTRRGDVRGRELHDRAVAVHLAGGAELGPGDVRVWSEPRRRARRRPRPSPGPRRRPSPRRARPPPSPHPPRAAAAPAAARASRRGPAHIHLAEVEVALVGAGLGVLVLFFAASRVTSCVFARDVRRKKRARQRLLRRQTELRERRAMLRRVARRLAEDAAQYAKLAEATDDGSDGRFEASGGPVGGSSDGAVGGGARTYAGNRAGIGVRAYGRRERSGLGSGAAAQDDVGMVEIARSPRYSPRYSPGPNGVAARGWRGPGSYREYLGSNPDGDGNDPGFGAGFGSVQGRARVASSSFPASGARTPARIASSRAAAAAAAATAVARGGKLAALREQLPTRRL